MSIGTLIAFVIALAIPLLALYIIRALDLFKSTRMSTLVLCMIWGAVGAFGLAYLINNQVLRLLMSGGFGGSEAYDAVVRYAAPVIEEILKALVLIYLIRQPSFRYFVDGAIYGFCVGIGFAVVENFFYIGGATNAALTLAITRVLSTSLMHAMASALVGVALGRLRRASGLIAALLPASGIVVAITVHVVYNNIVNDLQGVMLLLVAIGIGVGGAGLIGLIISQGLNEEKKRFTQSLGLNLDVSEGERMAIQNLGGGGIEAMMSQLSAAMGEENTALIRQLLITQANIGILRNNLAGSAVSERLRKAWEEEIAERQMEFQRIRKELDRSVMEYMQRLFPTNDEAMWSWLQEEFGKSDPTMVHTFDMFMRSAGLATAFTPEQLAEMAERLNRIEIFRNVSLADLENLGRAIKEMEFADGTMLFDQGDEGDAMYLVEQGGIRIYAVDAHGRENHLRTFPPGSVVGDFAVLDGQPRSARARADGTLKALVLSRQMFQMFIQSRPQVILAVLKVLADKARFTTLSLEGSVQNASRIAQGKYAEVARVMTAPSAPPAADEVTEVPVTVGQQVAGAFARFAATLEKRAQVAGASR